MVFDCATRTAIHWATAQAGGRERATAIRLRGIGHELSKDYPAALSAYREVLELLRGLSTESVDVAIALNDVADAEADSGDLDAAERNYREALRVAKATNYVEGVANYTGNLASVALERKDWSKAETLAREALGLAEKLGRQGVIAVECFFLARALVSQEKVRDALPYAHRAVEIFSTFRSRDLEAASKMVEECESQMRTSNARDLTENSFNRPTDPPNDPPELNS